MNKQDITPECKARVFGLYMGAEIMQVNTVSEYILTGVDGIICYVKYKSGNVKTSFDIKYCKLRLRNLARITDEDAVGTFNASEPSELSMHLTDADKIKVIKHGIEVGAIFYGAADYLRSKFYHLPYENINLVEAGVAVEY